jgi:cytochrome c oxidase subunit II
MADSGVFYPQSPFARATVDLLNTTLVISAVILALVSALVIVSLLRFRGGPNEMEPRQSRGHRQLEVLWTVLPFLLLVYLFVLTTRAMSASDPPSKSESPDVVVVGHQFWWEARYPGSGVVTANEIHIPIGRNLLFQLEAADVIHDFWVPQLSRKMDLIPEGKHRIWLRADRPGVYQGTCAEFCGTQHAWMRILVIAEPPDRYETWEQEQIRSPQAVVSPAAERGRRLIDSLTCVNCHSFTNGPSSLQAGPNLTHLASRRTLASGVVDNTAENLALWLRNPQAVKPGNLMPNMQLSRDQVIDLTAYLLTRR